MVAAVYSLTELRKFVAAFCSCTAFHPFGHRLTICFLLIFSMTRWVTLRAILWFLWLRPFSVVLLFLAGEAQIWPGDFRVAGRFASRRCFAWFLFGLDLP